MALTLSNGRLLVDDRDLVLRGAVVSHFDHDDLDYHAAFRGDIDKLVEMGGNFAIFHWNSGYLDSNVYGEKLVSGLEYAKSRGLRIALSLHARGVDSRETRFLKEQQIEYVDDSIYSDWEQLLSDPDVALRIGAAVDMFSPLSEPQKVPGTDRYMQWAEWKPIATDVLELIRSRTNANAIGLISAPEFASLGGQTLSQPPGENTGIELHPYEWTTSKDDYQSTILKAKQQGLFVVVGEFGFDDRPEFVRQQIEFFSEHGISFAWYAVNSARWNNNFLFRGPLREVTAKGRLAEDSFSPNSEDE